MTYLAMVDTDILCECQIIPQPKYTCSDKRLCVIIRTKSNDALLNTFSPFFSKTLPMYNMHWCVETECIDFLYIDIYDFGPKERLSEIFYTKKSNVTKMLFMYSKDFRNLWRLQYNVVMTRKYFPYWSNVGPLTFPDSIVYGHRLR